MSITKNSQWLSKYYPVRNNFVLTIQPFLLYNFRSFVLVFRLCNLQLWDSQFWLFSDVWYANIWIQWLFFWIENLNFPTRCFCVFVSFYKSYILRQIKNGKQSALTFTTDHLSQLSLCTLCSYYYIRNSEEFWMMFYKIGASSSSLNFVSKS